MEHSKTITFVKALEFEGRRVENIVLVEPTGGQVLAAEMARAAENGAHEQRLRDTVLISKVAGVSEGHVRKMPIAQFKAAAAFLNAFDTISIEKVAEPSHSIDLDPRIERNGRIVTALELREPTTGEAEESERKMGTNYTPAGLRERQIHLVCLVAELPRFIIEAVPISKLNEASRYLLGFI